MTQSFDDFKKYHNANYHDGSSHFDEQIYKKSNGDDFDCSFIQDCYDHFEAGQQSRQAEIDELQKRIDEALVQISNHYHSCVARKDLKRMSVSISEIAEIEAHESNMCVLENILKGKQDEK